MAKFYLSIFGLLFGVIVIDQYIKYLFVNGLRFDGECISLTLTYNRGVAFSMLSFLEENLKWIQLALLGGAVFYIWRYVEKRYYLPASIIIGGGLSNIADRFHYGGVVDYVYWHCGFDFAIFNFADVMIDIGVAWILVLGWFGDRDG